MTDATTALGLGDYATARDKALAAQGLAAILPDTNRVTGSGGTEGLTWDRAAISQFIDRMQKLLNSKTGMQTSKVVYRPLQNEGVSQIGIW